jgi:hypothetical protein
MAMVGNAPLTQRRLFRETADESVQLGRRSASLPTGACDPERTATRHGHGAGSVTLDGRRMPILDRATGCRTDRLRVADLPYGNRTRRLPVDCSNKLDKNTARRGDGRGQLLAAPCLTIVMPPDAHMRMTPRVTRACV